MRLGNQIITDIRRPSKELMEQFRGIPSSNIGDMLHRLYCMDGGMKAYTSRPMAGCAVTVKVPEGDNAFIHRAMDLAQAGDIIVVDGHGCMSRSLMGEIMLTYAFGKGIEGFVIDGAVRDCDSFDKMDISMYARGVTPQGPYKNGPGEINVPVCCGGVVVMPGDILVGDKDGICVIPAADAEAVLPLVQKKLQDEETKLASYHEGNINYESHEKTYVKLTETLGTIYE